MLGWAASLPWLQIKSLRGQTTTEYVLVMVAIAVALIVVFQSYGTTLSTNVNALAADF